MSDIKRIDLTGAQAVQLDRIVFGCQQAQAELNQRHKVLQDFVAQIVDGAGADVGKSWDRTEDGGALVLIEEAAAFVGTAEEVDEEEARRKAVAKSSGIEPRNGGKERVEA